MAFARLSIEAEKRGEQRPSKCEFLLDWMRVKLQRQDKVHPEPGQDGRTVQRQETICAMRLRETLKEMVARTSSMKKMRGRRDRLRVETESQKVDITELVDVE